MDKLDYGYWNMDCMEGMKRFPGKVVARVWDGEKNRPTNVYCEYENLKRCEDDVMSAGFIFKFPRTPEDDACIVETYMR